MAANLWGTISRRPRFSRMPRPLRLWIMLTVTLLVMLVVAGVWSAWWVVPHWTVGGWSARLQFILRSDTARSRWVRTYADILGSSMDQGFSSWLADEFQHLPFNDDRRTATIRFFALRAERNRVIRAFLNQDTLLMTEVVAVQRKLPVDERLGVVALLYGLSNKEGAYVAWYPSLDGGVQDVAIQSAAVCEFFGYWATLSEADRQQLNPVGIMLALDFHIMVP